MTTDKTSCSAHDIGARLKAECDQILSLGARMRSVAGNEYDDLFKPAQERLTTKMASIAFIGQVKAGKTSLVNGLIGKPDFLPSDVNPWTAVVTRLFFGKPDGKQNGAEFQFFDDEQWDKFVSRGGQLGELAAQIPDSEDKLIDLRAEVDQMRARAKMRLGEQFHALLGKAHRFETANAEVLARYICAGEEPEAQIKKHVQGRFADITRGASVFFEKERFAFPSILVDTPGLNDPLLIREEITLQSLEHSQIFVLVLSAHQAFSSSDLYLLRILNALRLDRLIIFVNRSDELTNPKADIPGIEKHIKSFLEKENPGADIPVIFGSAACALSAIGGTDILDCAKLNSIQEMNGAPALPQSSMKFDTAQQQSAWAASGLPQLEGAISEMIYDGPGKAWTDSARIDLSNAANIIIHKAEQDISELKKQLSPDDASSDVPDLDIEVFKAESRRLFAALSSLVHKNMDKAWGRMNTGLQEIIEDFIAENDKEFSIYLMRAKKKQAYTSWSCDTTPLRRDLRRYLQVEFLKIQVSVLQVIEKGAVEISNSMVEAGINAAKDLKVNTATLAGQNPTTTALSKAIPIDMDASWWSGWMNKFMQNKSIRTKMAKMIRSQFLPIQNELVNTMSEQLISSATKAMTSYQEMLDDMTDLLAKGGSHQDLTSVKDIESMIEKLENRIVDCKEVCAALNKARAA